MSSHTASTVKKLRAALQKEGQPLTQEAFAHLLGVSFATYNAWERARAAPGRDNAQLLVLLTAAVQRRPVEVVRALLEAHRGNRGALFAALLAEQAGAELHPITKEDT